MFFSEAEKIIMDYVDLLNRPDMVSKIARDSSLLPYTKDTIVLAYKVYMCSVATFRFLKKDELNALLRCLNVLDSFIEKDEVDYIELLHKRARNEEELSKKEIEIMSDYLISTTMYVRYDEVINILNDTQKFAYDWIVTQKRDFKLHEYYEYLYVTQIGLEYQEVYGEELYSIGMKRFNRGGKK